MNFGSTVIAVLRAALASDPDNHDVRIHLAEQLLRTGDAAGALEEATRVLAARPADTACLRIAATAAHECGADERAEGYERLLEALTGGPNSPAPQQSSMPARQAQVGDDFTVPDTVDEMVDAWGEGPTVSEPEPLVGGIRRADVTLADVGGMDQVKERLRTSFLDPMRNPHIREQFGKSLQGGLMLWGPPGCGKTFIARALAGEMGAAFYEVGLTDVLDMYIGNSEQNLRSVFEVARRNRPCVLFFDEVDALGLRRSTQRGGAMRGVVNQLLAELDGVSSDNEGIFVLAASNHPWDVDPALLRPGRFDRTVLVLPPDLVARQSILQMHLRDRPTERLDLAAVAKETEGYSGADLKLICDQATEVAMAASMRAGTVVPVTQRNLRDAVREVRPSIGEWMDAARNYALYANESGAYDELAAYLDRRKRRR